MLNCSKPKVLARHSDMYAPLCHQRLCVRVRMCVCACAKPPSLFSVVCVNLGFFLCLFRFVFSMLCFQLMMPVCVYV